MNSEIDIDNIPDFEPDTPLELQDAVKNICSKMKEELKRLNDEPKEWTLNDFQIGAPLGRGKFGRVYLARDKISNYPVALKVLHKAEITSERMQHQVLREIEIQSHLDHPNVLLLLTYFHDDAKIYLVLEFAGKGSLFEYLHCQPDGRFTEEKTAKFIYQVADALKYCHSNQVMHRDIKPENLLLDVYENIKLADFGWSVHAPSNRRKTFCGTLDYLPPEMVNGKSYSANVDHWCLGILCYELLVGIPPFESETERKTYNKIVKVAVEYPRNMPAGAVLLTKRLLLLDPQKRISFNGVMNHTWIVSNMKKIKE